MKEQSSIPTSKVERATKFITTGAKIGGNYLKHYTKKAFNSELTKDELHADNARDIYDSLSQLKGSALKVAQMLSSDGNLLPTAYNDKFTQAQYSAPPLSYPLVVKSFRKYFEKSPEDIFDTFSKNAVNAASIGQVHKATIGDKVYAVKIQYPGVAESIQSDLRIVRPIVVRMFNLNDRDLDMYMEEVQSKLLEETDYELEVKRSIEISKACAHLQNLTFPKYYPEFSAKRIITMDWMPGLHLKEFLKTEPNQETRNRIGQALWDFYDFQIHQLKQVHADPHPGNFLIQPDGKVGVIDFGCVKVIPTEFYQSYFRLMNGTFVGTDANLKELFFELDFLSNEDTKEEQEFFFQIFKQMTNLLGKPFYMNEFDFGDPSYFQEIYALGEKISQMKEVRNSRTARGSKHGIYINRTYFGLYNLLTQLNATVKIKPI